MNAFYQEFFKSVEGVTVFKEPNEDYFSNNWLSAILIDEAIVGKSREDLRLAFESENIECRPIWKPLHQQPVFEAYPYYGSTVSSDLFDKGLCLPSGSNLTDNDRIRIQDVLADFFINK